MFGKPLGKASSKTHKTALCIIPPLDLWPAIQKIRKKHDKQFRRWMPHINLLYPFKPKSEFGSVIDLLEHACSQIDPVEVCLSDISSFKHGQKGFTFWLKVDPEGSIKALQERLWKMVPECDELRKFANGYTPHLSIGQSKGKEKSMRLIESLQASWKPLKFRVSEISLIWRRDPPNDVFRVAETLTLGKSTH